MTDLLPLRDWMECLGEANAEDIRDYARANVARATTELEAKMQALAATADAGFRDGWNRATATKDAEIKALQAQLDEQCRLHAVGMERELALITERDRLRAEVERLWEIMRPKREKECLTLDHWRTRAYYLEANWSRCSRACAVEQTKREEAEALAKRLAEALRRYRNEVPLGHQPHMLAHEVDALLASCAALTKENSNDRQSTHAPD